jgi:glycosyltransferase involved in cell wall biosynthesis
MLGQIRFITQNVFDWLRTVDRGPLVTIVVPLYNTEHYVAETLQSVRKQNYTNWECIVVDDASPDRAVDVVRRFIDRDPRFRIVHHGKNRGLAASRNTGLQEAQGEFVTFLDSDDTLLRNALLHRVAELQANDDPALAGVYCGVTTTPEEGWRLAELFALIFRGPVSDVDFISSNGRNPFVAHAPLLRTQVVRKVNGFKEELRTAEDFEMWQRILRRGYYFKGSGRFGITYRQRVGSMIHGDPMKHLQTAHSVIAAANEPLVGEETTADWPYLFSEPLFAYQGWLSRMERTFVFASMAHIGGAAADARQMIETLPPGTGIWVTRHLNVERLIADAAKRLRLRLSDPPPEAELQRRIGEARALIMRRLNAPRGVGDSRPSEEKRQPGAAA